MPDPLHTIPSAKIERNWQRVLSPLFSPCEALGVAPEGSTPYYDTVGFALPSKLVEALQPTGDDIPDFAILLAAYKATLAKFCFRAEAWSAGGFDSLVLVPAVKRLQQGEGYLPIRAVVRPDISLEVLAREIRGQLDRAEANAGLSRVRMAEVAGPDGMRYLAMNAIGSGHLHDTHSLVQDMQTACSRLILGVCTGPHGTDGFLTYNASGIARTTATRFVEAYQLVLESIAASPDRLVGEIQIMDAAERALVEGYAAGAVAQRAEAATVVSLFEAQAMATPDSVAVCSLLELNNIYDPTIHKHVTESVTYAQLNARANQIARMLREKGIQRNRVVAICVEHPIRRMEALFGVLKSGGAYLPLDSRYPSDLQLRILEDTEAEVVLVDDALSRSARITGRPVVDISSAAFDQHTSNLPLVNAADDLCYVCFTSGTTSRVKGVLVRHRGLLNYTEWRRTALGFDRQAMTLQLVDFSADGFASNVYPTLAAGGTVVVVPDGKQSDAAYIRILLERLPITNMSVVPTAARGWLSKVGAEHLKPLRLLVFAGDLTPEELLRRVRDIAPHTTVANEYGPTEATVAATFFVGLSTETRRIIGRPIDNVDVRILNGGGELMPLNVPGEICIAGPGLAQGYLKNVQLTERHFVRGASGQRVYRTGDLGVWTDGGDLLYLGRLTRQTKLLGRRIEPAYLERRIGEILGVADVVVQVRRWPNTVAAPAEEAECLVAYVAGTNQLTADDMRAQLADELPFWMMPNFVVPLTKLPRAIAGGIDFSALPEPTRISPEVRDAPRTQSERSVAGLFARVLKLDPATVDRRTNFFAAGGHSLTLTQLVALIHSELRVNVKLSRVYHAPTVDSIAQLVDESGRQPQRHVSQTVLKQNYDVSSAQRLMYVMRYGTDNAVAYNTPVLVSWQKPIDADRLETAFQRLIERHAAFRTTFVTIGSALKQLISPKVPFALERASVTRHEAQAALSQFMRPFSLKEAPILRGMLLQIDGTTDLIALDSHHIVTDGASMSIILRDLARLYDGQNLPALTVQYTDFSEWQHERERAGEYSASERYWLDKFAAGVPDLVMPTDFERPAARALEGRYLTAHLDCEVCTGIERIARENGATVNSVLLASVATVLAAWCRQSEFVVGLSVSGRGRPEFVQTVGNFASVVPVICRVGSPGPIRRLLRSINEEVAQAYEHQEYPLDRLVTRLGLQRDAGRNPIFDVVFQFVHPDLFVGLTGAKAEPATMVMLEGNLRLEMPVKPLFDLVFNAIQSHNMITLTLGYSTALFLDTTAKALLHELVGLITRVAETNAEISTAIEPGNLGLNVKGDVREAQDSGFRF